MSTFWITVEEAFGTKDKPGGGGYTNFSARDAEGNLCFCNVGWVNANNQPQPGLVMEFKPYSGEMSYDAGNFQGGSRVSKEQSQTPRPANMSGGGGNRPAGTKAAPQARSGAANAPQGHSHATPTMSQAVSVFVECATAIAAARAELPEEARDLLGPGQVTTLFLGRLDGRIVRNPSAADLAAEAAAKAKELADAQAVIDAARAKLEAKAPGLTPMALAEDDGGDLPF